VYATEPSRYIVPDVTVVKDGDVYRVVLNEDGLPKLRISRLYRQMLRSRDQLSKDASEFLQNKLKSALWLIKSYGQRQRTIQRVAESIVKHQEPFLENGLAELRPMVLRDVADDIEMHESTVSRVVNGKYMNTPQGIYEMKFFFHSALGHTSGSDVSSVSVKEKIRKLIAAEDAKKPLSDARVAKALKEEGLQIARRTVAKYREELGIPASKVRRAPR
jgi:RNA polymerase sigma-54 factor